MCSRKFQSFDRLTDSVFIEASAQPKILFDAFNGNQRHSELSLGFKFIGYKIQLMNDIYKITTLYNDLILTSGFATTKL